MFYGYADQDQGTAGTTASTDILWGSPDNSIPYPGCGCNICANARGTGVSVRDSLPDPTEKEALDREFPSYMYWVNYIAPSFRPKSVVPRPKPWVRRYSQRNTRGRTNYRVTTRRQRQAIERSVAKILKG